MRVVLTGAAGRHGRLLLQVLARERPTWHVLATDAAPFPDCPVPFHRLDLRDGAAVAELLRGSSAVIHLGAVPGPSATPPPGLEPASPQLRLGLESLSPAEVLNNNVASAWSVFEGAARAGVPRLVFSSTIFAFGWTHSATGYAPQYLPVNEAHPAEPQETYGLSKLLGEAAAAATCRAAANTSRPLSVASLRFTNLVYPEDEHKLPWAAPSEERPEHFLMWCAVALRSATSSRARRHYTKALDCARAHMLAAEAPSLGPSAHEVFVLAAPTTRFREETASLASRWLPAVPLRRPLVGNEALICTDKARRMLGWSPAAVASLAQPAV